MFDLKYTEILRQNKQLGEALAGTQVYQLTMLSNVITNQLNEILEYSLRSADINAKVNGGDYDNIVQDTLKFSKSDVVVIFWELANLVDGLQYKANLMSDAELEALISKVCSEIDFVIANLKSTSLVLFNKFSTLIFNHQNLRSNNFDRICDRLNAHITTNTGNNFFIIDIDKILAKLSIDKCADFRYYYSSKALYTIDFYKAYAQFVLPIIKSVKGKAKKALIFDCDNTLWKGILGEDGIEKIEMSGATKSGVVFEEVQNLAIELAQKGILIGLCSKNNPQDVDIVLSDHADITLRNKDITIKKVNWEDKATNLRAIASDLNIGIDSLVFVDDSDFEANYIKENLPQVSVLQVPANLYEYPKLIRDNINLFFNITQSKEDLKKTEMYKQQAQRTEEKAAFNDVESYLRSLQLEITVHANAPVFTPRVSQLTQKTNQFNLTTKRYTEADIENFINNGAWIFAFEVKDKYGDSGITGAVIVQIDSETKVAIIDSFLMSCRVIGRNIEQAFFDFLIKYLQKANVETINAQYIKTYKNEQVINFYDALGFTCKDDDGIVKNYQLIADNYKSNNIDYIKVNYGTEN